MNSDGSTSQPITVGDTTDWEPFGKLYNPNEAKARQALNALVERYEPLIRWFIQRNGIPSSDHDDLCQDYLVQKFIKNVVYTADRSKGRFRTFLFHTLRQFIASHWRKEYAQKRGKDRLGSREQLDPEGEVLEGLVDRPSMHQIEFEIEMAMCVHDDVVGHLREVYVSRGQGRTFDALLPHLFEIDSDTYGAVPERLGSSPEAVRQNLSRLRGRYAEILVERVAKESLSADEDAKTEAKEVLKLIGAGLSRRATGRAHAGSR